MEQSKDIRDYLHLYLGCECMIGDLNWKREEFTHGLAPYVDLDYGKPIRSTLDAHVLSVFSHKTTLLLRRLSSLTEEEGIELYDYLYPTVERRDSYKFQIIKDQLNERGIYHEGNVSIHDYMNWFLWLLSKGFDLFNLIDSGLALDKDQYGKEET